ncbi:hypothetical protein EJB05_36356, partial [Eragrostis curvula]
MSLFQKVFGFEPHISMLDRPREGDQELPDEDKVEILHMARCHEFTECDPKYGDWPLFTRFDGCYNLAFFDLDEESKVGLGPPLSFLSPSGRDSLDSSVNVISLKITESDLDYPINVFGSVIARDEVDYKCVYLFRRDRDDPQIITSPDDELTLTGPYRGLAVSDVMYFETNLKVRCDGTGDRALSKGVIRHNAARHSKKTINMRLPSWLSTVELVLNIKICYALEATVAVTVLKGPPDFNGKLTAWTTGNEDDHIVLFDSEASGTWRAVSDDGSVALSRRVVSVAWNEELVLRISVGDEHNVQAIRHSAEKRFCRVGSYELKVEVNWTGNVASRRKRVFRHLGATLVFV